MRSYFSEKRVVVTGGAGFLGKYVVRKLQTRGCAALVVPRRASCDLRKWDNVSRLLDEVRPHLIIHLAGVVSGIGGTRANPGGSFYDNLMMGVQLLEAARQRNVEKVVVLGTVRSYPKMAPIPTREEELWNGYPEEINAPYGMAKKIIIVQSKVYRQQYGFNSVCLLAANLYGPGAKFNCRNSHVIPALIRRFSEAVMRGDPEVVCWGNGASTCSFLHAEDCAEGILLATELYNESEPVNLASREVISVRDLAERIACLVGFRGAIVWDHSQPAGQPCSCWDVSRAERAFGFSARKNLDFGLKETILWYRENVSKEQGDEKSHAGTFEY